MKLLNFAICLTALFATTYAVSSNWGTAILQNRVVLNEGIVRSAAPGVYSQTLIQYPKPGQANAKLITAIAVEDRYANNSGAIANLVAGGPGYNHVTISLTSRLGEGINSIVSVLVTN